MKRNYLAGTAILIAALTPTLHAAGTVVFTNTSNLLPNTPNQTLQVFIQGSDLISGENLNIQINDASAGPIIGGVDLVNGTIFAANHQTPTGPGIINSGTTSGRLAIVSLTTVSGLIPDNGLLVTLTVSTGASGTFALNLTNTANGSSNLVLPNPSNTNNTTTLAFSVPHSQLSIGTPDRQWTVNGNGDWDTDSHWTPFAPYAQGDIANFLGALSGGTANVTLDGDRTVGVVNFNNAAGSYVIAAGAGGILRLNNGTAAASISDAAGSHVISAPIVLSNTTNLSVGAAATLTLGGNISGSQPLSLTGPGTLVLTGLANAYGATNVAAGSSLIIGGGTSNGSLGTGPINNSGHVTFTGPSTLLVASPLGGTGDLTVTNGILLTTTDTATLTTITSTGVLTLGDPGGLLGGGAVTNNGGLVFNRTGAVTHSSPLSGSGTLTQQNSGTTTLGGAYTATGPIRVTAGNLTFATTNGARRSPAVLLTTNSLSITNNGSVVDITNHDLMITNNTPASSDTIINTYWKNGTAALIGAGNPAGPQITSSTAINNVSSFPTFIVAFDIDRVFGGGVTGDGSGVGASLGAYTDNQVVTQPGTIMVKYGYYADIDFSGKVDAGDINLVLGSLGQTTPGLADPGLSYLLGDVDYSGKVDAGDINLVLGMLGAGNGTTGGNPLGALDDSAPVSGAVNVPEPTSLALLSVAGAMFFRRRKPVR